MASCWHAALLLHATCELCKVPYQHVLPIHQSQITLELQMSRSSVASFGLLCFVRPTRRHLCVCSAQSPMTKQTPNWWQASNSSAKANCHCSVTCCGPLTCKATYKLMRTPRDTWRGKRSSNPSHTRRLQVMVSEVPVYFLSRARNTCTQVSSLHRERKPASR